MQNSDIINELKSLLEQKFPQLVAKIIMFGSRVKGTADEFSDYDILLILNKQVDWRLEKEIQSVCWDIDYKFDLVTDVKMICIDDLSTIRGKQAYIQNALIEGIAV